MIGNIGFQSTPPCEGATRVQQFYGVTWDVSIHAPVRGGDYARFCWGEWINVSIVAPVRGGDLLGWLC